MRAHEPPVQDRQPPRRPPADQVEDEPLLDDLAEDELADPGAGRPSGVGPPLRRSRDDGVIAGVCSGLGRYLGVDAVLLRIAFVVLAVGAGSGVVLYLIAWVAIPEEREAEPYGGYAVADRSSGPFIVGAALVMLGGVPPLRQIVPLFDHRVFWPLVLIGIGLVIAMKGARR